MMVDMDDHLLFSYGTLQLPSVQIAIWGTEVPSEPDAVVGHALDEVQITDAEVIAASGSDRHPMLVATPDPDAEVPGTVFALDDAQLAAADAYEVDAYRRVEVALRSGRTAWAYALAEVEVDAGPREVNRVGAGALGGVPGFSADGAGAGDGD